MLIKYFLTGLLSASLLTSNAQTSADSITTNPALALITSKDVVNFWYAFDKMGEDKKVFEKYYINVGSNGVNHFLGNNRIVNGDTLYATVTRRKDDYLKVRTSTLNLSSIEKQCRSSYYAFKYLYPKAIFPPLYFVIGRFNTGGVSLKTEQIIGAEMNDLSSMPYLVAHELIHSNQNIPYKYKILLEQCIIEGSADFLGELISGKVPVSEPYQYAKGKEVEIWNDFLKDINLGENDDFANWLYAGKRKDDRPADLGYYIGYIIAKSYYEKAKDKIQAIADILNISDCKTFLNESGYQPK